MPPDGVFFIMFHLSIPPEQLTCHACWTERPALSSGIHTRDGHKQGARRRLNQDAIGLRRSRPHFGH
jgi:hypothetical protein